MQLTLSILFFLILLTWSLFKSRIKGVFGEKKVLFILNFLDRSHYKVINNIVLNVSDKTIQIDHVVISDYGIFVIETKNYQGWILGNENSYFWTQVIFKRKEKLYNPIRQNLGHIWALKSCLREFPDIEYKSIIVFPRTAHLKVNTSTDVIYSHQLLKTIKRYSDIRLTEADKDIIFKKIISLNVIETYDRSQHIKSIKQRIKKKERTIAEYKCPQCSDDLIIRNGKFGKFLGCTSYPRCKFSRPI